MNKKAINKKSILGLLLVGCLSAGVAVGTYAAFKSTATSKDNKIKAGRLEINYQRDSAKLPDWIDTTTSNAKQIKKPGDELTLTPISIKNTGDLNMVITPSVTLTFTKESRNENKELVVTKADDLYQFMIKPVITTSSQSLDLSGISTNNKYVSLTNFKNDLENYIRTFKPGDEITINGTMKLDSSAENEYEGAGVVVDLGFTGDQETSVVQK